MILELVNPSDKITFDGDDPKIAGVATLLLSNGWYALTTVDGNNFVPLMGMGCHENWLKENGIENFNEFCLANAAAIADFLDTCVYGTVTERTSFVEAIKRMTPEKAAEYKAWWDDKQRSSMTNIGKNAANLAKHFRKLAAKTKKATS